MNKLFLILSLLCVVLLNVNAQQATVELSAPLRQNQKIKLNDLLQFQVNSEEAEAIDVFLQVAIEKRGSGMVSVLKTELFKLPPGITLSPVLVGFNGAKLQVVSARTGYQNIKRLDFLFPDGQYNYCVELRDREGVIVHKDCAAFEQVNPFAFYLIYPFDQQKVEEDRPTFTWTPLLTADARNVDYRIRWIERDEPGNPKELFYTSQDFYQIAKVKENVLPYKVEYPDFDPTKYYYWQVEAYSGRTVLARSDIWEFSFPEQSRSQMPTGPFVKVDLERFPKLHQFTGDFLSFEWTNDYNDTPFEYKIVDYKNAVVVDQVQTNLGTAENGKNFFHLNVSSLVQLNEVYTLIISGSKRDYEIKFKRVGP